MITLRQHVASLVAVFMALSIGIALGGGPLSNSSAREGDDRSAASSGTGRDGAPDPAAEYAEAFAAEGAARMYADGLHGHAVAVLRLPGTDAEQLKDLNSQVVAGGGAITATFDLGGAIFDPDEESTLDDLSAQLVDQLDDPRLDPTAPTYVRMGQLLALAVSTDQTSSVRADAAAVAVRQSFAAADLLTAPSAVRSAPLVLLVLPPGEEEQDSGSILPGLAAGLGSYATGVVVVGDELSAASGELAALRQEDVEGPVATVDGLETTIGQVTTVLALISVLSGTGGSYGESGADGPVPFP